MATSAPATRRTYKDYLADRPGFPLDIRPRVAGYLFWRDRARLERRIVGSRLA